ncbi:MAG: hypothetical protein EOO85_31720 [Pedobacter sp.]|nr:MAG: hypothetical protein EOO85_31720 [Pedobacter sp.]
MNFMFTDAPDTACFVCTHVLKRDRPILYVTHTEEEGFWSFLCGYDDHHYDEDYSIISLEEATAIDESINNLHDMPIGVGADRATATSQWEPFKIS